MFDDPKKELQRLEEELLKYDEKDEEFEKFYQDIFREFGEPEEERAAAPAPRKAVAANTPRNMTYTDVPRAVAAEPKKSNKGLVILLCVEIAGILGVAGYWLMKFL